MQIEFLRLTNSCHDAPLSIVSKDLSTIEGYLISISIAYLDIITRIISFSLHNIVITTI